MKEKKPRTYRQPPYEIAKRRIRHVGLLALWQVAQRVVRERAQPREHRLVLVRTLGEVCVRGDVG
jgi:hypothetical protein